MPRPRDEGFEDRAKEEEDQAVLNDQRIETIKFYLVQHEAAKIKKLLQADGEDQVHTFVLE